MILGVGIDLLNVNRLIKVREKFDDKFSKRILSEEELKQYKKITKNHANFLAKRFCAKEAFAKALGIGIGRGLHLNEITISNDILGKPIISLTERGCNFLENLYKVDYKYLQIDLSITDETPYINTIVIVSKI